MITALGCSAAPQVMVDAAAATPDASAFPAFSPSAPQVVSRGGYVLLAPKIVAAVFDSDPMLGEVTSFVHEMRSGSEYWHTIAEYGVGALLDAKVVVIHETPPASVTVDQLEAWIAAHVTGANPVLGTFEDQTMYTVFYPATTNLILDGSGPQCQGFGGFHLDARLPDGRPYILAALPRCPAIQGFSSLDLTTTAASHEWLEGAPDPYPTIAPAYQLVDADHAAWGVAFSDYPIAEIGDMCALTTDDRTMPAGFTHRVQRIWSNAAAHAGQDPCVPAPAEPYFTTVPVAPDAVTIKSVASRGVKIPVGTSKTIDLQAFSTGPTEPWTVTAYDLRALLGEPKRLELSFVESGPHLANNGDVLHLTIKAIATGPLGGAPLAIYSTRGTRMQLSITFVAN